MVILLPVLITILFVVVEASQAYMIKESLANGARQAARDLAVAYGQNSTIANNRSMEDSWVFDNIRIKNIINSDTQFDDPVWDTSGQPPTVTVTVNYTSGQNGLPPFPNPDPLKLGNNFKLNATATYRLE
jgi:Flp pilus assembly protein TadG